MLPCAACVRLRALQGGAAPLQARSAQARSDLEHRGRPQADGRATRTRRSAARGHDRAHAGILRQIRPVALPRHDRAAVPGREPLRRRMRRQEVRQLRRVARHRLRDHTGVLPRAVAAVRLYRLRPAGWAAGGGPAARRGEALGRQQGAGGYSGRARARRRSIRERRNSCCQTGVSIRHSRVRDRGTLHVYRRFMLLCMAN